MLSGSFLGTKAKSDMVKKTEIYISYYKAFEQQITTTLFLTPKLTYFYPKKCSQNQKQIKPINRRINLIAWMQYYHFSLAYEVYFLRIICYFCSIFTTFLCMNPKFYFIIIPNYSFPYN